MRFSRPRLFAKPPESGRRRWRLMRFREAVAESTMPALQRGAGSSGGGPTDIADGTDQPTVSRDKTQCPSCKGAGVKGNTLCPRCGGNGIVPTASGASDPDGDGDATVPDLTTLQESAAQLVRLTPLTEGKVRRLREATATDTSPVYEVELLVEGLGNKKDKVFYTKQALREAVNSDVFSGMQAYANHPGKDEEYNRPERDIRELVGYYRNFKFKESGTTGKPTVTAELVVNQGQQWFVDLLESAIAAKGDGVQLCGISIDGGGLVEVGEVDGQYVNMCRQITEAPSADVVTRAAAGGNIVRRLRESVARTQLPQPKEAPMKVADFKPKLSAVHTALRESVAKLTTEGASDEQVAEALKGINDQVAEVETLAGTTVEAEVQFREAEGGGDAEKLAKEKGELEVKLREAEGERDGLKTENGQLKRSMLAAQALREAEIPAEAAGRLFGQLVQLDSLDAMKAHLDGQKTYEEELFTRFRESLGIGAPSTVEGVPALVPAGAPSTGSAGGAAALEEAGIPLTPEPAASA